MKTNFFVEFQGKQTLEKDVIAAVKKEWTAEGNKVKDIDTLDIYVKPEEATAYYVINGEDGVSGAVEL
ncbi:MAG: DUF6465 family protein [Lachnospiraceae bacterium]|nr:DUF6465 family protein [Lachnospiraceae bacterium]